MSGTELLQLAIAPAETDADLEAKFMELAAPVVGTTEAKAGTFAYSRLS